MYFNISLFHKYNYQLDFPADYIRKRTQLSLICDFNSGGGHIATLCSNRWLWRKTVESRFSNQSFRKVERQDTSKWGTDADIVSSFLGFTWFHWLYSCSFKVFFQSYFFDLSSWMPIDTQDFRIHWLWWVLIWRLSIPNRLSIRISTWKHYHCPLVCICKPFVSCCRFTSFLNQFHLKRQLNISNTNYKAYFGWMQFINKFCHSSKIMNTSSFLICSTYMWILIKKWILPTVHYLMRFLLKFFIVCIILCCIYFASD